uniref:Integrase catalytic domain-containing protein n=1 Tax=Picea glauca TaxID=3330 RepID=A0A101LX54_PICGL|nr:hypothetical protein ABT39_MTgene6238 [Picea glauca]QHR87313.1 hypothetical protein Q903MT_gene1323 [Picea sitchensis]
MVDTKDSAKRQGLSSEKGRVTILLFPGSFLFKRHQRSCPHTPEQNGVAERKHRHIMETARSLLLSSSVPRAFWGEAVFTSVYLMFRTLPYCLVFCSQGCC